ncbi:MAG TPA: hypothetical protein V6C97_08850 [Oculatellaceae cyanobacterium]
MSTDEEEATTGSRSDFNIYLLGEKIDSAEKDQLESEIERNPSCVSARLKLLCYYHDKDDHIDHWIRHTTWMIFNCPDHWITGNLPRATKLSLADIRTLRDCWTYIAPSMNPKTLNMVAMYLFTHDEEAAICLLKTALNYEPSYTAANRNLLKVYMAKADHSQADESQEYVRLALEQGDRALSYEDHVGEHQGLLIKLANFALAHKKTVQARTYAEKQMEMAKWLKSSRGIAQAHCMIGRVAMQEQRFASAKRRLLLSAEFNGFPEMTLANELLAMDEKRTVVRFLEKCLVYLHKEIKAYAARGYVSQVDLEHAERLANYLSAIKNSEKIDFGFDGTSS